MHRIQKARRKKQVHETLNQKLARLARKPFISAEDMKSCQDLINWKSCGFGWNEDQKQAAANLVARHNKIKPIYLYAITDGEFVKLGYSSDIEKRVSRLQTGHPKKLGVVWHKVVGLCRKQAAQMESDLHIKCREHKQRGEWFGIDCMEKVFQFEAKI